MVKISIVKKNIAQITVFQNRSSMGGNTRKRGFTIDNAIVIKKNVHNF